MVEPNCSHAEAAERLLDKKIGTLCRVGCASISSFWGKDWRGSSRMASGCGPSMRLSYRSLLRNARFFLPCLADRSHMASCAVTSSAKVNLYTCTCCLLH